MSDKNPAVNLARQADFSRVLEFARELIRQQSLSGQERPVAELCLKEGKRLGYDECSTDALGNFIGRVKVGPEKGPKIVLTGHLDTVNAEPSAWGRETQPFAAAVKDGKLFGRGASDMKGALACMLHAAALCRNLPGEEYAGEIYLVGTVVEELFEGVCFLEAIKAIRPRFIVVGEASECRLKIGQRGRAEVVVAVHGISRHASSGRETINPLEQVAEVLLAFHRQYQPAQLELIGRRDFVPTDIKIPVGGGGGLDGRGGNSTVPNRVEVTYDARLLPGDTIESIVALVNEQLEPARRTGRLVFPPGREPEITIASDECTTYTGKKLRQPKFAPAWKMNLEDEIVIKGRRGVQAAGLPADIRAYSFCTDGSAVVELRRQQPELEVQVVGFGPSREELAHVVDEYVEIDELKRAHCGYAAILAELLRR